MLLFALDCTSDYANQHIMLTKQHYSSSFFSVARLILKAFMKLYTFNPRILQNLLRNTRLDKLGEKIQNRDFSLLRF